MSNTTKQPTVQTLTFNMSQEACSYDLPNGDTVYCLVKDVPHGVWFWLADASVNGVSLHRRAGAPGVSLIPTRMYVKRTSGAKETETNVDSA